MHIGIQPIEANNLHKPTHQTFAVLRHVEKCRRNLPTRFQALLSISRHLLPLSLTLCNTMDNGNPSSIVFTNYFRDWINRGQFFLDELLSARNRIRYLTEDMQRRLVERTLSHYQQYYEEKLRVARRDVFIMFSPPWFTTYERTFLWIAGFKPGLPFRVVYKSVTDLSQEQVQRMNRLKAETMAREKELSDELARIQEGVASSYLAEDACRLVRRRRRRDRVVEDGEARGGQVDDSVREMREMMEALVQSADVLRMAIVREIVEILNLGQSIRFLAAATQLHMRIRMLGVQKDASRTGAGFS